MMVRFRAWCAKRNLVDDNWAVYIEDPGNNFASWFTYFLAEGGGAEMSYVDAAWRFWAMCIVGWAMTFLGEKVAYSAIIEGSGMFICVAGALGVIWSLVIAIRSI